MTKEQKSDIKLWINLRIMNLNKMLIASETEVSYSEKAIIASQLAVYGEMQGLLDGTLIVKGSKLIPS